MDRESARHLAELRDRRARILRRVRHALSFRYLSGERISVTTGSLDEPARARPTSQIGIESRVPWFGELPGLPASSTADNPPPGGMDALGSRQYQGRDA